MAHTAHTAERVGIAAEKENALWEFERSPLFSEAERAALRVAQCAAQVPNAVTDADFAELKKHYTDAQIVDIVAVISLFGFLNRFNDTWRRNSKPLPSRQASGFWQRRAGRSESMLLEHEHRSRSRQQRGAICPRRYEKGEG
jgi:hypothetical protein